MKSPAYPRKVASSKISKVDITLEESPPVIANQDEVAEGYQRSFILLSMESASRRDIVANLRCRLGTSSYEPSRKQLRGDTILVLVDAGQGALAAETLHHFGQTALRASVVASLTACVEV